ncbi:leucine-rich repeat extensin-like protein 3 [Schistocerca americana]|uniref:leucine-rich repeat extensin-like protein 3 n=1 Tax=Schistocerca americana TaxID=7009 RepID=UPI001F50055E|nr:leucine-rich repeat extensin-like protein 3 [Schistocerca americana]
MVGINRDMEENEILNSVDEMILADEKLETSSAGSRGAFFASLAAPYFSFLVPQALSSDTGNRSVRAVLGFLPPPTAPPPLAPPPRKRLPASPLPVRSPAPDGRLSPLPRPHLQPLPPPCSSAAAEPMDAEADVTPPPPSPMEVVFPPPHPSIPSGGARPGQVFHGAFSSPPREQFGIAYGQRTPAVQLSAPSAAPPGASFQGRGMWYP